MARKSWKKFKKIKYLGVLISQDGKNMPDILEKRNRSIGTQKLIRKIILNAG